MDNAASQIILPSVPHLSCCSFSFLPVCPSKLIGLETTSSFCCISDCAVFPTSTLCNHTGTRDVMQRAKMSNVGFK